MNIHHEKITQLLTDIETVRRRKISDASSSSTINYIDPSNFLNKLCVSNNHIIQGRRGSGKTTLLIKRIAKQQDEVPIKIDCQLLRSKSSGEIILDMIRKIVISLSDSYSQPTLKTYHSNAKQINRLLGFFNKDVKDKYQKAKNFLFLYDLIGRVSESINDIDKMPNELKINRKSQTTKSNQQTYLSGGKASIRGEGKIAAALADNFSNSIGIESIIKIESMIQESKEYKAIESSSVTEDSEEKIIRKKTDVINNMKEGISQLFIIFYNTFGEKIVLYLDDFYLISDTEQVEVIRYLHDVYKVCVDSCFCFKMSVLPHRIKINPDGNFDLSLKDDFSPIRLDYDLADFENLKKHLLTLLINLTPSLELSQQDIRSCYTNDDVINYSIIASGGIPRDFIVLFSDLVTNARANDNGRDTISKENIYSVVMANENQKRENIDLDSDITPERIDNSIAEIKAKIVAKNNTNVFLYPRERTHEEDSILRNLVNLRYIHPIKENISSETVKKKTYDAYLVDMIFYATGRRMPKDFNFREFWVKDEEHRQPELHRAPILQFENKV